MVRVRVRAHVVVAEGGGRRRVRHTLREQRAVGAALDARARLVPVGLAALPRLAEGERVLVRVRIRVRARARARVRVSLALGLGLTLRPRLRVRVRVRAWVTSIAGGGFHPVHTSSTAVSHLVRVGARARVRAGARTVTRSGVRSRSQLRSPVRAIGVRGARTSRPGRSMQSRCGSAASGPRLTRRRASRVPRPTPCRCSGAAAGCTRRRRAPP